MSKPDEQLTEKMQSINPAPKKRGRKPLTDAQKAERLEAKKQKAELQRIPPSLKVSFVCRDDEDIEQKNASHKFAKDVMNPAEVISLLNSTHGGETSACNIPPRSVAWSSNSINTMIHPGGVSQIMEESEDDEEASILARPRPNVLEMSEQAIVSLMGAHTDVKNWPSSTNICCWNCCHQFEGVPIPAPSKIDKRNSEKLAMCYGVFCSFNCAKRYIIDKNTHDAWRASTLLSLLHKRVVGHQCPIKMAPPRICLKMFGGNMTIDEYRYGSISLPAKDMMYENQARAKYASLLQSNCIPTFHRVLFQKTNASGVSSNQQDRGMPKHERKSILRSTALHQSMNMNMF